MTRLKQTVSSLLFPRAASPMPQASGERARRVVVHRPGGYGRLCIESSALPVPAKGEVLIEVEAAGVNYADCMVRMGIYGSAWKYVGWPITPGFEVAGRVVAVGPGVDGQCGPGDPVFAVTRFGGYTTHASIAAHQVFRLPPQLSAQEAAGFPTVFLTAWYALRELVRLREGMHVLVHSAAGGVGSALVQIARAQGCRVIGVVGASHKVAAARANGADVIIDKSQQNLWREVQRAAPDGCDVVLDANGVETLRGSYAALRPTGKLIVYGFHNMIPRQRGTPSWLKLAADAVRTPLFSPLTLTSDNKGVLGFNLSYLFDRSDLLAEGMRELTGWLAAGKLSPLPLTEIPLDKVADAHRAIESGQTVGKLVLVP